MQAIRRLAWTIAAAAALACITAVAAGAQNISVLVNGQAMTFSQPPVMRGGRVFVPMRAIFERLGSSVVYANGQINAQGNGRSVHLAIGSPYVTINGQQSTMDVAPFEIAGRTEVPLRFVAQALGANVSWNGSNDTVYIGANGSSANYAPASGNVSLTSEHPASGATVHNTHPAIRAQFNQSINRDSLQVSIDGRSVTSQVYANTNGFDVSPDFALSPGSHSVNVTGTTASGASFSTGWSFSTSSGAAANVLNRISPSAGSQVRSGFTLSGHTRPGSAVHIVASGEASALGGLLQVGTGTYQTDATADSSGNFSVSIPMSTTSGGQLRVIVTSTAPDGSSVERSIVYST